MTPETLDRLRDLLAAKRAADKAFTESHIPIGDPVEDALCIASVRADDAFESAVMENIDALLDALLDAADRTRLQFGPEFGSKRCAVATDGAMYVLSVEQGPWFDVYFNGYHQPGTQGFTTAEEAIAAAQRHDAERRRKS